MIAGPRQPWHDIHCQVHGPLVWDLLTNYVQRWRRQAGKLHQEELLNLKKVAPLELALVWGGGGVKSWFTMGFRVSSYKISSHARPHDAAKGEGGGGSRRLEPYALQNIGGSSYITVTCKFSCLELTRSY